MAERVKQWTEESKQQGKLAGCQEEAAQLLRRLLTVRFGPLTECAEARVNEATREPLETWALRILDAPTLEAVLHNETT